MTDKFRQMFTSRSYITAVLVIWIFSPEVRRLFDFYTGTYHQFSLITLMPMLSLMPGAFFIKTEWSRMGPTFQRVAALWLIGFGYSFFIGLLTISLVSAAYGLIEVAVPMLFAVLLSIANRDDDLNGAYDHVASVLIWCCLLSSLYGIYQFASPPAWDVFWAQHAGIEDSQGQTIAFAFRIFGTLNSTGPFSICLAFSILMNLRRLRSKRWWIPLVIAPQLIALILTSARASWIILGLGIALYLVMSPYRKSALAGVLASTVAVFAVAGLFLSISGGAQNASATFMKRVATFSDISDDNSFNSRVDQTQALFKFSLSEPLGQGLGAIGLSAKLGSAGEVFVIDNGYIARFVEMGFIGVAFFMASVVVAVVLGFSAYRDSTRSGDPAICDLLAICFALQVMFLSAQAGADSYFGSQGMFFWLAVYFASVAQKQAAARRNVSRPDSQRIRPLSAAV